MIPTCHSLMCSFNRGNIEGTNSSEICVWCLYIYMYVLCLWSDWFCRLTWQRVDTYNEKSLEMCFCLWPEFDCPEVTLCGWQDIKIQLLLLLSRLDYCSALLVGSPLIKFKEWSTAQLASSSKLLNLPAALPYFMILDSHCIPISSQIQYKIALNLISFYVVSNAAPPASLSCFFSSLLLTLFMQHRILGSELLLYSSRSLCSTLDTQTFCVPRKAEGPWGRGPLNMSDLWSGTLFPSLSGIHLYSLLLSQNWNPISSLLHTDLSFSSRCTNQSLVMHRCICSVCGMWESVCVCVFVWWNECICILWDYISNLGACEIGHHK